MKKRRVKKGTNDKIFISIIIIVIAVFIVIASIVYRNSSYTQTWLVCDQNVSDHYHEVIKYRYDINDKLYGYYREENISGVTPETLEVNYQEYLKQYKDVEENLDDNFQYEIIKSDNSLLIKTYIGVSVYPAFFNRYINNEKINSSSKVDDVKAFLESNGYKCEVTRK